MGFGGVFRCSAHLKDKYGELSSSLNGTCTVYVNAKQRVNRLACSPFSNE